MLKFWNEFCYFAFVGFGWRKFGDFALFTHPQTPSAREGAFLRFFLKA